MSALLINTLPVVTGLADPMHHTPRPLALAAAIVGGLAPWLLLVGAYGGLARSAASCFAGPMPV